MTVDNVLWGKNGVLGGFSERMQKIQEGIVAAGFHFSSEQI